MSNNDLTKFVHIGQIYDLYYSEGILIGHLNNGEGICTALFFRFYKPDNINLTRKCLVYYTFENEEDYIVSVIDAVDHLPHAYGGSFDCRADGNYHYDKEWELIKQKSIFYKDKKIWMPKTNSKLKYEYSNISLSKISQIIFDTHFAIKRLNDKLNIDISRLANKIVEIENYIDSINLDAILSTYEVASWGFYKREVGKDNFYCYGNYKRIDSDDNYIRSLLPLEEKSDYYNKDIQTDEEQDFTNYDNLEAERNIKLAKHKYSKKEHLAFLLNEYYSERQETKVSLIIYKIVFRELFSLSMVDSYLLYKDKKAFVKKYNNGLYPQKIKYVYLQSLIDRYNYGYFD